MRKAINETRTQLLVHMTYHDCCFPLLLIFFKVSMTPFLIGTTERIITHTLSNDPPSNVNNCESTRIHLIRQLITNRE